METKNTNYTDMFKRYQITDSPADRKKSKQLLGGVTVIALLLLLLCLCLSCEQKELCYLPHPHDKKICHTELKLNFNTAWDNTPIYSTYATAPEGDEAPHYNVRYVLEFWTLGENNELTTLIEHREVKDGQMLEGENAYTLGVDLPATRIAVMCWAEPIVPGTESNPHFDSQDLRHVKIVEPYGKRADKDAFTGSTIWDFTEYQFERNGITLPAQELALLRPFGRYTVITNDVLEYYEKQGADAPLPVRSTVKYQLWIPPMFDVFQQITTNPLAGVKYDYPVTQRNEEELTMAEDILFIGTKDTGDSYYNFTLQSFAADQTSIHQSGNVAVRMQRNKQTLVTGAFLTDRQTNSPGIDDSFDDTVDVVIPD